MINVYVNSKTIDLNDSLHENCYTILKPSTMIHIAHKLLHLAATNNSDGGHYNTRFRVRIIIAFVIIVTFSKFQKPRQNRTQNGESTGIMFAVRRNGCSVSWLSLPWMHRTGVQCSPSKNSSC